MDAAWVRRRTRRKSPRTTSEPVSVTRPRSPGSFGPTVGATPKIAHRGEHDTTLNGEQRRSLQRCAVNRNVTVPTG